MFIVKFKGGLGNQMFQYALYLAIKNKKKDVLVDTSFFSNSNYSHYGFELIKLFNLDKEFHKSIYNKSNFKDSYSNFKLREYFGRIFFNDPNRFIIKSHYIEKNFSEYYNFIFSLDNIFLDGYWQSEYYFKDILEKINNSFKWNFISNKNKNLANKMCNENSVSLHVRRFDKIRNFKDIFYLVKLFFVYRTTNKKYYFNAINYINKMINNPIYYIFTDDINWVNKNFDLNKNFIVVDSNFGSNSYQDMYLMSKCMHNIISMSTFSWWGAWLNANINKIVITPKSWASRFRPDINLIPEDWIRI